MTKISIVSDAPSDRGKSFGGRKIQTPKQYNQNRRRRSRRSRGGGGSSTQRKPTKIYIVSDAPEDVGRSFAGQKILTTKQYNQIRSSNSNIIAQKRALSLQEKNILAAQRKKEQELRDQARKKTRNEKVQRINSDNLKNNLNKRIQAATSNQIRENQQNKQIDQSISIRGKLPEKNNYKDYNVMTAPVKKTYDDPKKTKLGNKFDEFFGGLKETSGNLKFKAQQVNNNEDNNFNPAKKSLLNLGASTISGIVSVKEFAIDPLRTPIDTAKQMISSTNDFVTKPSARTEFLNKAAEFGQRLQSGDPIAAGQVVGTVLSPRLPGAIITGAAKVTETVKFIGAKELPRSDFTHKDVISEKTTMPSAKGTKEIIDTYNKADGQLISFSPQKLGKVDPETGTPTSNPFKGKQVSGDSRKGALGQEDGGINTAPKGVANDYFTRIDSSSTSSQYTLNPKKIWQSIKSEFQTPTATEFNSKGVVKPPKDVLNQPGFEAVKKWQKEELAGTGKVTITKRSLLGQGELPRQSFQNVRHGNKIERERGTSEFELNIPQGQEFTQTGSLSFIKVKGKKVAIRKAEMVITKDNNLSNLAEIKKQKLITTEKLLKEQKINEYSSKKNKVEYKSPLNQVRSLGSSVKSSKSNFKDGSSSKYGKSKPNKSSSIFGKSPGKSNPSSGSSNSGSSSSSSPPKSSSGGRSSGSSSNGSSFGGSSGFSSSVFGKPPLTPKIPSIKPSKKNKVNPNSGYDVFIREKGKRIKVNKKIMPYNMALKRGKNIVDNTVAGSFEIVNRGKTNIPDIPSQIIGNKFRARKTKNALRVVEKSKNRIDTRGEKQGLSVAKFLKRFQI